MPTVTVFNDMAPQPRARIQIETSELDPATSTLTVLQISVDGERAVRDGIRVPASAGALVTDYEIPPGVEVTYQARQYDINGAEIGLTATATAYVPLDVGWVIISDPLAPAKAIKVRALRNFAEQLTTSRAGELYRAGKETLVLMGNLSLLTGINLGVFTYTEQEATQLRDILSAGTVLFRTAPPVPLPRALYVAVRVVVRTPVDRGRPRSRWPLTGDEVSRPLIDTIAPVFTYGYYKAALAALGVETYGESKTMWTTYLDSKLNPPPEA